MMPPDKEEMPVTARTSRTGTVLLVEEHEALRDTMEMTLRMNGYEVRVALSAREALAIAEDCRPEAIVIDLSSGLDARWLVGAVRNHIHLAGTPMVGLLSGRSSAALARNRSSGFVALLEEPFSAAELVRAVERCMSEPPRPPQPRRPMRWLDRFPAHRPTERQRRDLLEGQVESVYEEATSRGRVLVLIDHPALREAVTGLLREHEYSVHEAGSLAAALEHAEIAPPDVVVVDVTAGGAAAAQLVGSFRRTRREVPLLALAADSRMSVSGFDALVFIPYSGRQLLEGIERLIERDPVTRH